MPSRVPIPSTLEIEIEQLDRDEDRFSNQVSRPSLAPEQLEWTANSSK